MWSLDASKQEFSQKRFFFFFFFFFWKRDFYAGLKIWKWIVKAYTVVSFKTHLDRFSKQKSYPPYILLFVMHKFVISIKWFSSGKFRRSPKHEENIPWYVLEFSEPYRKCSRENLCVCVCSTTAFGNEELCRFPKTPKLILSSIQTIDIGLKQRLMKKLKPKAYYHKLNSLAEKAQIIFYAFLNHFSILSE